MLQQYKQGNTYYGYDNQTGELVAFSSPQQLQQYFPQGVQKNAPQLPTNIDSSKANATPGQVVSPFGQQSQLDPNKVASFDPSQFGIPLDQWKLLSPAEQSLVETQYHLGQQAYAQGQSNYSINAKSLQDALTAAQSDPQIKAKYGDAAIVAQQDLQNSLGFINAEYAQNSGLVNTQQEQERKALSEQEAAAGRAYSGFRKQAEERLGKQQNAVIQSSKRQLEQQVRGLGSAYERQFGTPALSNIPPVTAGGSTYQPYGGLTGQIPASKSADIANRQQQIYSAEKNPLIQ